MGQNETHPTKGELPALRFTNFWKQLCAGAAEVVVRQSVGVGERPEPDMGERAAAVVDLIRDEPWFTYHVDHDDGIERTELQLALCRLARVTPSGHEHTDDDGCLEYMEQEDLLDASAADQSAAVSPNAECREQGHAFPNPHEFRDACSRCGCVRVLRGNPSRFTYEYPT